MFRNIICLSVPLIFLCGINAVAQTIPGIPDSKLAAAHIKKGCGLAGAAASVQKVFGSYALALSGSGHIPDAFLPNGTPISANMGLVWCRFNREMSYTSDFMIVRYQSYASEYAAVKGFDLAVNAQNRSTPGNRYSSFKKGSLTFAVRNTGEVIALSGPVLASAAWYVPADSNLINSKVAGTSLMPIMYALLCPHSAASC